MFADLKLQFENTYKQYEDLTTENKQSHSVIANKLNEIHVKGDSINEFNLATFDNNVKQEKEIGEQIEKHVEVIKQEISSALEEVCIQFLIGLMIHSAVEY